MKFIYDIIVNNSRVGAHVFEKSKNEILSIVTTDQLEEETRLYLTDSHNKLIKTVLKRKCNGKEEARTVFFHEKRIEIKCGDENQSIWFNDIVYDNTQLLFQLPLIFDGEYQGFGNFKSINIFAPFTVDVYKVVVFDASIDNELRCFQLISPYRAQLTYDKHSGILLQYQSETANYCLVGKTKN